MPYVAMVRNRHLLLTGWVSTNRARMIVAENPGAIEIDSPDRVEAYRVSLESLNRPENPCPKCGEPGWDGIDLERQSFSGCICCGFCY